MIYNICHFLHQYAGNGGGIAYAPHGAALGRAAGRCYAVPDGFMILVCLEEPSRILDFPRGQPVIDKDKAYHPDGFMPDWEYMAAYIRAIEKLVIKDVVDFKDAFIVNAKLAVAGKEAV